MYVVVSVKQYNYNYWYMYIYMDSFISLHYMWLLYARDLGVMTTQNIYDCATQFGVLVDGREFNPGPLREKNVYSH